MNDSTETHATDRSDRKSPPVWFWVISVIAMLWFLMDVWAFYMRVFMTEDTISAMPEHQQNLYQNMPPWVNIVYALEVFGGVLGCQLLMLRKKWALPLFVVSFLGVISQTTHIFFSDAISVMGASAVMMPLLAILIGAGMIVLTRLAISRNWLG